MSHPLFYVGQHTRGMLMYISVSEYATVIFPSISQQTLHLPIKTAILFVPQTGTDTTLPYAAYWLATPDTDCNCLFYKMQ